MSTLKSGAASRRVAVVGGSGPCRGGRAPVRALAAAVFRGYSSDKRLIAEHIVTSPFAPPTPAGSNGAFYLPIACSVAGAAALVGGLFTPLPMIGGVIAMLFGNYAMGRALAIPGASRTPGWRAVLGLTMAVTASGVLAFVGLLVLRITGSI